MPKNGGNTNRPARQAAEPEEGSWKRLKKRSDMLAGRINECLKDSTGPDKQVEFAMATAAMFYLDLQLEIVGSLDQIVIELRKLNEGDDE